MKKLVIVKVLVLVVLISCTNSKKIISVKDSAIKEAMAGNYDESVERWREYFGLVPDSKINDGDIYANAAKAALKNNNIDLAEKWMVKAKEKNYGGDNLYLSFAKIYRGKDNLSKELSVLEYLYEKGDSLIPEVNNRLFSIYYEIEYPYKAMNVWSNLTKNDKDLIQNIEKYFLLNKQLKNTKLCDSISVVVLDKMPENKEALLWNAKKYYKHAEERYIFQMEEYEKKKTVRQYRILLKQLDIVTVDYKKSLGLFEKLWKFYPQDRYLYASYLSNIYVRFHNEQKALYYRNYIKK